MRQLRFGWSDTYTRQLAATRDPAAAVRAAEEWERAQQPNAELAQAYLELRSFAEDLAEADNDDERRQIARRARAVINHNWIELEAR